jgi:hypothetical protein
LTHIISYDKFIAAEIAKLGPKPSQEARHQIYDRERKALIKRLSSLLNSDEDVVVNQVSQLEGAISHFEYLLTIKGQELPNIADEKRGPR